mmetsp:Transcript_963/g.2702  ORF Transcript_963/g.2702 Transcript_963/m.2702 type:complete len:258 (-) Transcript_963:602-1375(-)
MRIKHIPRAVISRCANRSCVPILGFFQILQSLHKHIALSSVKTMFLFDPQRLDVRRPAFLEPGVCKSFHYHSVAEISVRHLVDVDAIDEPAALSRHLLVIDKHGTPGHKRNVLHCATYATFKGELIVLVPRHGASQKSSEPHQHLSRAPKGPRQRRLVVQCARAVGLHRHRLYSTKIFVRALRGKSCDFVAPIVCTGCARSSIAVVQRFKHSFRVISDREAIKIARAREVQNPPLRFATGLRGAKPCRVDIHGSSGR